MKAILGILKKVGIFVLVLIVLGAVFGGGGSNEKSAAPTEEAAVEQKEEPKPVEEKKVETKTVVEEEAPAESTAETVKESVEEAVLRPEFKEAMDSYEAFFDEYVDFMKRYQEDPSNTEMLMQLSEMMTREADMLQKFDAWQNEGMSTAESAYYLEVQARIYAKLAEVM